jgi:hypothetical protein
LRLEAGIAQPTSTILALRVRPMESLRLQTANALSEKKFPRKMDEKWR